METMPDWEKIFEEKGHVFTEPHSDMNRIVKTFHDNGVKKVLDLGCGTGRHLVYLSGLGFEVWGFDVSATALSLAKEWLEKENCFAQVLQHKMEEPFPYTDGFFDGVISTQVIHHNLMSDILQTVSEVQRVLRTGGVLFVTFPILSGVPLSGKDNWNLEQVEPGTYIPRSGPEAGVPHHYFEIEEIHEVFSDFSILEIFTDDTNHRCVLGIKK
jgi:SAM-dependent methyltransferase